MADLDHKQVHEEWSKIFLVNNYEDWSLEIDPEIKEDFATIALFLDYKTAKSSGEEKEVYEGIKKAFKVLHLASVLLTLGIGISNLLMLFG